MQKSGSGELGGKQAEPSLPSTGVNFKRGDGCKFESKPFSQFTDWPVNKECTEFNGGVNALPIVDVPKCAPLNSTNEPQVLLGKHSKIKLDQDEDISDDEKSKKTKKKKSGILTKPDESDIVQTVKYAHELLDDRHVKGPDKVFNKLNFPLFCAGEIELIRRPGIGLDEKEARLGILATICYHFCYVDISELKAQYDATLKRVERGVAGWSGDLADRLHQDLAFRAAILARERNTQAPQQKQDKSTKMDQTKKQESKLPTEGKIHYCADFNRGSCSFSDNHEGKLNGKDVLLWHLCKRCLFSEGKLKRFHPETDPDCPSSRS